MKSFIQKKKNTEFSSEIEPLIEDISKYYIYIKENTKYLKFFINSNADHFFKCLSQVIINSNKFYNDSLKSDIADYCSNFGESLNMIINSIYIDSNKIDANQFTDTKKKFYLDKVGELTKFCKERIHDKIQIFNISISIRRLNENKNLSRNGFTKLVEEINKENKENMDHIQKGNLEILEKFKENLKELIREIQKLGEYNMKKYKDMNSIDYDVHHHSFENQFIAEENLGLKLFDNNWFLVSACIPFVNYISVAALGLTSLIDWARGHEKEYEEFIKNYEKNLKENIDNYEFIVKRQIEKLSKESCDQIENIFAINGKDINKIQKNKDIFKNIGKTFENYLNELIINFQ